MAAALATPTAFGGEAPNLEISPDRALIRPYRGIAYVESDVPEVRRLARDKKANAEAVRKILETARQWLQRSDEEIVALIPKPGAAFAHGYAGDPKTGQSWPRAGTGNLCNLSYPGEVRSPYTGDVYGIQKEGEPYYDPGDGWVRPSDGRRFYFKALWNSFVARSMHEGVDALALAYLLTGEPETARKALFILDRLATLRKQTPDYKCMIDSVRMAETKVGFFCYQGNLANQRVINSALALDLVGGSPAASAPSSADPKMTMFANIEENYFDLYEREFYLDQRGSLTNHGSILFGNVLAQGVLFGRPDLLSTGIEALYAFIDSTINRDGDYLELAGGYGRLGRDYGSRLVAILNHYRVENYKNTRSAHKMPDPARYPFHLRIADEPRWYATVIEMLYRLPVAGRYPQYGDVSPDRDVLLGTNNKYLDAQRRKYLRMYYHQTSRPDWKREIERLYQTLPENTESRVEIEDLLLFGISQWAEVGQAEHPASEALVEKSDLMGGKAIAILRSGEGKNRRALFMRGGGNGPHGHDDQMAIVPYGHGMVLAGVYGYGSSETPDHLGWGSRAISHLTATVNEDLPWSYLYKGFRTSPESPAGSVTGYAATAPAQFVEMRNPALWAKASGETVEDYRRSAWLVDVDAERYYFFDVFQIVGGKTHDYPWNAPYGEPDDAEAFVLSGVEPVAQEGVWTLASLSGAFRAAYWNQPGKSWGERLDGKASVIRPLPNERNRHQLSGQKHPPSAPGNGYGMIWDVKAAATEGDWQAVWKLQDNRHFLRASFLNYDGMTVASGRSPSLLFDRHFHVVVARRSAAPENSAPLNSRFVNVVEVGKNGNWAIAEAKRLVLQGPATGDVAGAEIRLQNGMTDYLIASRTLQTVTHPALKFTGRHGFARIDDHGGARSLMLSEATTLEAAGWRIEASQPALEAKVISVHPGDEVGEIVIDRALPTGSVLAGATLLIRDAERPEIPYTHDEYLAVEEVAKGPRPGTSVFRFRKQSLVMARFQAEKIEKLDPATLQVESRWPSEVSGMRGVFYLRGRSVHGEKGPLALMKTHTRQTFNLNRLAGVRPGELLRVVLAKAGDKVVLPVTASLTAQEDGSYLLRTNADLRISPPPEMGGRLLASVPSNPDRPVELAAQSGNGAVTVSPAALGSAEIVLKPGETPH